MAIPFPSLAANINEEAVLEKCRFFTEVGLWPLRNELDPRPWLEQFLPEEKELASYLLNSFLFLSDSVTNRLFVSSVESLGQWEALPRDDESTARAAWDSFVSEVVVTPVRGERPRPTDSGMVFARKARDLCEIDDANVRENDAAIEALTKDPTRPLLFVDDFVGSGNQFLDTWEREHDIAGRSVAFSELSALGATRIYYCPVVATEQGLNLVRSRTPVIVSPAHMLPDIYSALHPSSIVWPEHRQQEGAQFVFEASQRAGIPDTGGGVNDWRGFYRLGLTLAFEHGVPDATLPLFWWESDTWTPLKPRPRS
jgi:hypothetical protein